MAKTGGPNFIDGFASVQAVKHSKSPSKGPKTRQSSNKLPALEKPKPAEQPSGAAKPKRISRSVIPEKFTITCYECQYVFTLGGKVIDNFCPKCHEKLLANNVTIEKKWSKDIKTIGRVEIKKGAEIGECKIIARELSLAADASKATLTVNNKLELLRGAGFNVEETVIKSLVIPKDANIALKGSIHCESLEVFGTVKANLHCSERAIVEQGGNLNGSLQAPSLVVYEGAALKAKLKIGTGRK